MAAGLPALAQAEQTEQAGQTDPTAALASRSAVVVLGTVLEIGASAEPLLAPSAATAVIRIDKMYAGSELAGDQTGHKATVILSKPGEVKVGTQALFFGNPRYIGKTLTIADLGEMPAPPPAEAGRVPRALEEGLRARRDAPLKARLTTAAMAFRGTSARWPPRPPRRDAASRRCATSTTRIGRSRPFASMRRSGACRTAPPLRSSSRRARTSCGSGRRSCGPASRR
jgi:hypothetical protein